MLTNKEIQRAYNHLATFDDHRIANITLLVQAALERGNSRYKPASPPRFVDVYEYARIADGKQAYNGARQQLPYDAMNLVYEDKQCLEVSFAVPYCDCGQTIIAHIETHYYCPNGKGLTFRMTWWDKIK